VKIVGETELTLRTELILIDVPLRSEPVGVWDAEA
jgi:hypothetical protein